MRKWQKEKKGVQNRIKKGVMLDTNTYLHTIRKF